MLSALDEATNKRQSSQQSDENTEGFFTVFMKALNSGTSQGTDFDRNNEEGKLVSHLEQTSNFLSNIVKVSLLLMFEMSVLESLHSCQITLSTLHVIKLNTVKHLLSGHSLLNGHFSNSQ